MDAKENTVFDKTEFYSKEISDKVDELVRICTREKMPMFISICVKNDDKETEYKNDMVSAYPLEVHLKDDMIPRFVNILNGFVTTPKKDELEVEYK